MLFSSSYMRVFAESQQAQGLSESQRKEAISKVQTPFSAPQKNLNSDIPFKESSFIKTKYSSASNRFAFRIAEILEENNFENENLVCAPLSIFQILALISAGLSDENFKEVCDATSIPHDLSAFMDNQESLLKIFDSKSRYNFFKFANSIWVKNGIELDSSYKERLESKFGADIFYVDFTKSNTLSKINEWVNTNTNGLVKSLNIPLYNLTEKVLINVNAFKMDWYVQFSPAKTYSCQE